MRDNVFDRNLNAFGGTEASLFLLRDKRMDDVDEEKLKLAGLMAVI